MLEAYQEFTQSYGLLASFIKFALLATLGELIGLKIKTGRFYQAGFGLLPRALVWGFLGTTIYMAFAIFSAGTPVLLAKLGGHWALTALDGPLGWQKLLTAFSISTALNFFYAPVMMSFHKITDAHIVETGGRIAGFFSRIDFARILHGIDWKVQWHFVFKRTIPLFWIPAQTITFLLPEEFRVLFAAFLGIILGVLLALAALRQQPAT